ncbi:MAG: phosphatidylserine decarboxylase [Spirochaetaceae bacterium]|nr:phosphatidylserine decarboxylase [Spirochaetaceae bacterium]
MRSTPGRRIAFELVRLLPKNALSRLAGRFAEIAWPGPVQRAEIRLFARLVGVDLAEARDAVEEFATLQQFFGRALVEGARPIEGDEQDLVSPCDGAWGAAGRIESGTLLQVKGRRYPVAALLGDAERAALYEGGTFATFYLSPRDYHRFHTPLAGRFERLDYFPGALWPVNRIGLEGVEGLFAVNERICAYLRPEPPARGPGEGDPASAPPAARAAAAPIALVAVGATMVGSVRLRFDEQRTNRAGARPRRRDFGPRAPFFARGQEWGHFEFGSTIVMLLPPDRFTLDAKPSGRPLRMGRVIGRRIP